MSAIHGFGPLSGGAWTHRVVPVASSHPGCSRLQQEDGSILSVQPDGRIETRPSGTDGPYEWCLVTGSAVVYAPDTAHSYPFGLLPLPQ
jgi:hypothetical protein